MSTTTPTAKRKTKQALVTERNASNNPHLENVIQAVNDGYKANRRNGQTLSLRKHRTAMTPNDKPVWVIKKDGNGNIIGTRQLLGAGWYLSAEEVYMRDEILKDPEMREFNERIWASMENQGLQVEKSSGSPHEVRVVSDMTEK